jgi:hypothetical protein
MGNVNPKAQPNRERYIRVLRAMTPSQRLEKAFELSEQARQLFIQGLRERFPDLSEADFHSLRLKRLAKCHNRNY